MGARGRGALAVVHGNFEIMERPAPPPHISEAEAVEWRRIVEAVPGNWFTEDTFPLLEQYCRHVVRARHFAHLINEMEGNDLATYDTNLYLKLLREEHQQSKSIAMLANRMRLTQQQNKTSKKRGGINNNTSDPWNYSGGEETDSE